MLGFLSFTAGVLPFRGGGRLGLGLLQLLHPSFPPF